MDWNTLIEWIIQGIKWLLDLLDRLMPAIAALVAVWATQRHERKRWLYQIYVPKKYEALTNLYYAMCKFQYKYELSILDAPDKPSSAEYEELFEDLLEECSKPSLYLDNKMHDAVWEYVACVDHTDDLDKSTAILSRIEHMLKKEINPTD